MRGAEGKTLIKLMKSVVVKIPVERIKSAEVFLLPPSLPSPSKSAYGWEVVEILRELGVCSLAF